MTAQICVAGAGAMGSIYGGLLSVAGSAVTLLDPWAEHVAAINARGLHLDGITGDRVISIRATTDAAECPPADIAIVQVNGYQTEAMAAQLADVLKPGGYAITLQNGIGNVEALTSALGKERVLGGLSYHSGALRGPGHVSHTHRGPTWLGEIDGSRTPRLDSLSALLKAAGFEPVIVDDIMGHIWGKFIHNCAINAVAAVSGLRVGEIARNSAADEMQTRIIEEALALIAAKGITLPEQDPMGTIKAFCRLKYNRPSMLQHLESGRPTEVDSLNGALVREARAIGLDAPYNDAIAMMLKARERYMELQAQQPIDYDRLEAEAKAEAKAAQH